MSACRKFWCEVEELHGACTSDTLWRFPNLTRVRGPVILRGSQDVVLRGNSRNADESRMLIATNLGPDFPLLVHRFLILLSSRIKDYPQATVCFRFSRICRLLYQGQTRSLEFVLPLFVDPIHDDSAMHPSVCLISILERIRDLGLSSLAFPYLLIGKNGKLRMAQTDPGHARYHNEFFRDIPTLCLLDHEAQYRGTYPPCALTEIRYYSLDPVFDHSQCTPLYLANIIPGSIRSQLRSLQGLGPLRIFSHQC